jgi:hypothetical protein
MHQYEDEEIYYNPLQFTSNELVDLYGDHTLKKKKSDESVFFK